MRGVNNPGTNGGLYIYITVKLFSTPRTTDRSNYKIFPARIHGMTQ